MVSAFHITSIVVFFVLGIAAGILPIVFARKATIFSYMNLFAAGVFLIIGLASILKEALEKLEDWEENELKEFPMAYFLCVVGFLIILCAEEVVHAFFHKITGRRSSDDFHNSVEAGVPVNSPDANDNSYIKTENGQTIQQKIPEHPASDANASLLAALVLLLALSIHEIFEGIAIGAQENTWGLFIAIVFHKSVESFALGAAFVRANVKRVHFYLIVGLYSLTLPLGIAIGLATTASDNIATGILLALSSGSFLYIATVEIIPHELSHRNIDGNRLGKLLALFMGVILMTLLKFFEELAEHAGEEGEEEEGEGPEMRG